MNWRLSFAIRDPLSCLLRTFVTYLAISTIRYLAGESNSPSLGSSKADLNSRSIKYVWEYTNLAFHILYKLN